MLHIGLVAVESEIFGLKIIGLKFIRLLKEPWKDDMW